MFQLVPNRSGQNDSVEQSSKNVYVADQQKIVDRAGVIDDEPHSSKSQLLKRCDFPSQVLDGIVHPHIMGLQKTIQLIAGFITQQPP